MQCVVLKGRKPDVPPFHPYPSPALRLALLGGRGQMASWIHVGLQVGLGAVLFRGVVTSSPDAPVFAAAQKFKAAFSSLAELGCQERQNRSSTSCQRGSVRR